MPAARAFEEPRLPRDGAGERAALVAEELALEEVVRDGREVDAHERLRGARGALVEEAREAVLARAGRPEEEHGVRGVEGAAEPPELLLEAAVARHEEGARTRGRPVRAPPRCRQRNAAVASGASPQSLSRP